MINTYFISLPKEFHVPPSWQETLSADKRVIKIAQSRLAEWSDAQLKFANKFLTLGAILSGIGLGISVLVIPTVLVFHIWVSIPIVIALGISLGICLLGSDAINHEQRERNKVICQQLCFEIEDTLIEFKNISERINLLLALQTDELVTDKILLLIEDLNHVSEKDKKLKDLIQRLKTLHHDLYGDWRMFAQQKYSHYWMSLFESDFGNLYKFDTLKKLLETHQDDPTKSKSSLKEPIQSLREQFFQPPKNVQDEDLLAKVIRSTHNYQLTGRASTSPLHMPKKIDHLMAQIEYWRQNIAVFRSSLK